ncbi:MAG: ferredoxin [Deltaproteobacteria bacterium]|nr:MAG: ferredoxin [Deltaproteobacteria bacterium]
MKREYVDVTIDGREIRAPRGEKILWVALENGIEIPHLCALKGQDPPWGGCRLCWVEVEGRGLVTACTEPVRQGMVVHTDTPSVRRLQRRALELLLADHPMDCKNCPKRDRCELLKWMRFLKVKVPKDLRPFPEKRYPVDTSHPVLNFDPNKCILCGRCVWIAKEVVGCGVFDFVWRGYDIRISTFMGKPLKDTDCNGCLKCAEVCPVGALWGK